MTRFFIRLTIVLLCALAGFVAWVWLICAAATNTPRWLTIAKGFDQTANAAFAGHEDITISTRAAQARDRGERWGCLLCYLLDKVDPDHCTESLREMQ